MYEIVDDNELADFLEQGGELFFIYQCARTGQGHFLQDLIMDIQLRLKDEKFYRAKRVAFGRVFVKFEQIDLERKLFNKENMNVFLDALRGPLPENYEPVETNETALFHDICLNQLSQDKKFDFTDIYQNAKNSHMFAHLASICVVETLISLMEFADPVHIIDGNILYHLCYTFFEVEFSVGKFVGNLCYVGDIVNYFSRGHNLDLEQLIKPWPEDLFEFLKKKKKLSKKVGDIWVNGEEERVKKYAARLGLREKKWVGGQDIHDLMIVFLMQYLDFLPIATIGVLEEYCSFGMFSLTGIYKIVESRRMRKQADESSFEIAIGDRRHNFTEKNPIRTFMLTGQKIYVVELKNVRNEETGGMVIWGKFFDKNLSPTRDIYVEHRRRTVPHAWVKLMSYDSFENNKFQYYTKYEYGSQDLVEKKYENFIKKTSRVKTLKH